MYLNIFHIFCFSILKTKNIYTVYLNYRDKIYFRIFNCVMYVNDKNDLTEVNTARMLKYLTFYTIFIYDFSISIDHLQWNEIIYNNIEIMQFNLISTVVNADNHHRSSRNSSVRRFHQRAPDRPAARSCRDKFGL